MIFNKKFYWKKHILPVVIQNKGRVVMLAYMSISTLLKTLLTGYSFFWSRERKNVWLKGQTSGNFQIIKNIYIDCDQDSILIDIYQINNICCHLGEKSCFKNEMYKKII